MALEALEALERPGAIQRGRSWARAERRAGELLSKMTKHPGARAGKTRLHDATTLADLGITRVQSHRWRRMGEILAETERAKGDLLRGNRALPRDDTPTLADLGITKRRLDLSDLTLRGSRFRA